MPTERPNASSSDIQDLALELVEAKYLQRSEHSSQRLEEFRARSAEHEKAVRRAERYVLIARMAQKRPRSRWQMYRLRFDVWLARFYEPQRLSPAITFGVIVIGAAVLYAVWAPQPDPTSLPAAPAVESESITRYRTAWREQREVTLSDGSTVWLGWNTDLEVRLSMQQRIVSLNKGVAAFLVSPDLSRSFVVNAGGSRTEVTGTEFVVNYQQSDRVEIAVLEGQVRVSTDRGITRQLGAEQVVIADKQALGAVMRRSQAEIGRWREGMLVFNERPVLQALKILEPYTRYRIDASHVVDTGGRVSGVFFTDQADDALMTILQTHRFEYTQTSDKVLRLRNASASRY